MVFGIIFLVRGVIWGRVVNRIIENKGYRENWFWWGFFLGIVAVIWAWSAPDKIQVDDEKAFNLEDYFKDGESVVSRDMFSEIMDRKKPNRDSGEWRCSYCGKINAIYVGTCGCGCNKSGIMSSK